MTHVLVQVLRIAAFVGVALVPFAERAVAQEINLYTTREPGLIQPLMDSFTKSSGIKVNSIFIRDGLAERVAAEGTRSPADVLMTVDIGDLLNLVDKNVTQGVQSSVLNAAIPAKLRGSKDDWYTL